MTRAQETAVWLGEAGGETGRNTNKKTEDRWPRFNGTREGVVGKGQLEAVRF